jgi:hypothetical protein
VDIELRFDFRELLRMPRKTGWPERKKYEKIITFYWKTIIGCAFAAPTHWKSVTSPYAKGMIW